MSAAAFVCFVINLITLSSHSLKMAQSSRDLFLIKSDLCPTAVQQFDKRQSNKNHSTDSGAAPAAADHVDHNIDVDIAGSDNDILLASPPTNHRLLGPTSATH